MTQEEKELLLKDLCARLPYRVKGNYQNSDDELLRNITIMYRYLEPDGMVMTGDIKPYLFPISSMTEKQIEKLRELCNMYTPDDDHWACAYWGIKVLYKHIFDDSYKFIKNFKTDVIDFFHKNHIDYRGLIPMGLAIDATDKNIY